MLLFSLGNNFFLRDKNSNRTRGTFWGRFLRNEKLVSIEVRSRKRIYSSTGIVKIFLIYNHDRSLLQLNK